ncbi:MAG: GFA family protein [Alphaproteobacteria bacterium]|nr:GFA family protein [Alphaproteobacteria bacterium]
MTGETMREAACSCGQLRIACEGEPLRVSVCHCLACQRRTGSAFSFAVQYPRDRVAAAGRSSRFSRAGDSGNSATFHFCPACGTTLYWEFDANPDRIGIAAGAFADPRFPPPRHSVYEEYKHAWVTVPGDVEHFD